jgi:hypothetical protein
MTVHFFPERSEMKTGFRLDCDHVAEPTSLPDTYRLLSVFSGVPTPPMDALRRAGLASTDPETGQTEYSVHAHATMSILVARRQVHWVSWTRPDPEHVPPIPAGYVLTGFGELTLTGYFQLHGPALPGRS